MRCAAACGCPCCERAGAHDRVSQGSIGRQAAADAAGGRGRSRLRTRSPHVDLLQPAGRGRTGGPVHPPGGSGGRAHPVWIRLGGRAAPVSRVAQGVRRGSEDRPRDPVGSQRRGFRADHRIGGCRDADPNSRHRAQDRGAGDHRNARQRAEVCGTAGGGARVVRCARHGGRCAERAERGVQRPVGARLQAARGDAAVEVGGRAGVVHHGNHPARAQVGGQGASSAS